MLKVWGFSELKPEQKIIEEKIFDIVKKNYRKFWYTPIETPSVEKNEVLTAKVDEKLLIKFLEFIDLQIEQKI